MGSNTSTTIQQLQEFQHQEEHLAEGNTISSLNNNSIINNNNNSSNNSLRQRASSMRESWSSLKQLSPSSSPNNNNNNNNNNNLTSSDEEKNNNSLPLEKQPSILGFVGDLIGIKQTATVQHHHKAIRVVDMEQQHSRISESSILSSPLRMANNNTNNINVNNNNGNDDGFQPIYSSKSAFSRPRAKSYGSSLKNSQSSSTNSSSVSNNSILTRNQVHLNSSYDNWNTDTICWEEFKRKSIEREKKRNTVPKDVSSSWSPSHSGGQSPNTYQNSQNVSMSMNMIQSPRRREGIILAPITNRVGMEVERTGIGNFLKNLEQPSRLTQSIK